MRYFTTTLAALSLSLTSLSVQAQEASPQPTPTPTTQQCTVQFVMGALQAPGGPSAEQLRGYLASYIIEGDATSWPAAAERYQEFTLQGMHSSNLCVGTSVFHEHLLAMAGVNINTPLPQTRAEAEAEAAAAQAAAADAEAARLAAEREVTTNQARRPAAMATLQRNPGPNPAPAVVAQRRAAEVTLTQFNAAKAELAEADRLLALRVAALENAQLTLEQVNSAITTALDSRFNPQSADFFLKDPAVVREIVKATADGMHANLTDGSAEGRGCDALVTREQIAIAATEEAPFEECLPEPEAPADGEATADTAEAEGYPQWMYDAWELFKSYWGILLAVAAFLIWWLLFGFWPFGKNSDEDEELEEPAEAEAGEAEDEAGEAAEDLAPAEEAAAAEADAEPEAEPADGEVVAEGEGDEAGEEPPADER